MYLGIEVRDFLDFFMNIFRGSGDGAESPGLSIGGETNQIGVDPAVFARDVCVDSLINCVACEFRGGRVGGFPAFLGQMFGARAYVCWR